MARAPKGCQVAGCPGRQPCPRHPRGWAGSRREMPSGWSKTTKVIKARFNGICQHCGGQGTDVDHIIAHADGGSDSLDNLTLLCQACHRTKTGRENGDRWRK